VRVFKITKILRRTLVRKTRGCSRIIYIVAERTSGSIVPLIAARGRIGNPRVHFLKMSIEGRRVLGCETEPSLSCPGVPIDNSLAFDRISLRW
jgi:hypothetical protein